MTDKLFPTPDSIPFDVEEIYTAIQEYKGYPSSRVKAVQTPRLRKELAKSGWSLDNNGYLFPKGKLMFPKFNLNLFSRRKKYVTAWSVLIALLIGAISLGNGCPFVPTFWVSFMVTWTVLYCCSFIAIGPEDE